MFSDTDPRVGSTAVRIVTCDLSSFTESLCCSDSSVAIDSSSSSKRKAWSKPLSLLNPDTISPLAAKRLLLGKPTVIDKLISKSKTALRGMEGRRSITKLQSLGSKVISKRKKPENEFTKRKREESISNGTSPVVKRLRSSKAGSESDSSPSRNASAERKPRPVEKSCKMAPALGNKAEDNKSVEKHVCTKDILLNKNIPSGKKSRKSERSRFSKRICFPTLSLRSGKKRVELLKRKRIVKGLSKDGKVKRPCTDKTDSNSNFCTENESNDETVYNSTDSEISRGPSDFSDSKEKIQDEDNKKRKRRRKRDSMWVKKVKKQLKGKAEQPEPPPSLKPFNVKNDEQSKLLEELPVLDKESDDSIIHDCLMGNSYLNSNIPDDVPMPMLEKEIDISQAQDTVDPSATQVPNVSEVNNKSLPTEEEENACTYRCDVSFQENEACSRGCDAISSNHSGNKKLINEFVKLTDCDKPEIDALISTSSKANQVELATTNTQAVNSSLQSQNILDKNDFLPSEKRSPHQLSSSEKQILGGSKDSTGDKELAVICPPTNNLQNGCVQGKTLQNSEHCLKDSEENKITMLEDNVIAGHTFSESDTNVLSSQEKNTDINLESPTKIVSSVESQCTSQVCTSSESQNENSDTGTKEAVLSCESNKIVDSKSSISDSILHDAVDNKTESIIENDREFLTVENTGRAQTLLETVLPNNQSLVNDYKMDNCEDQTSHYNEIKQIDQTDLLMPLSQHAPKKYPEVYKENFVSSAQYLEEEISKLEAVLSETKDSEPNCKNFAECQEIRSTNNNSNNGHVKILNDILLEKSCEANHKPSEEENCESLSETTNSFNVTKDIALFGGEKEMSSCVSKDVSLLDADSTSDMKPQSLDDSFGDFSLSLPDDLELESSPSDEEREDEMDILPDSTEGEKPEEPSTCPQSSNELAYSEALTQTSSSVTINNGQSGILSEMKPSENKSMTLVEKSSGVCIDISEKSMLKQELPLEHPLDDLTPSNTIALENKEPPKTTEIKKEELTVEQRQMKESVLQALGLKSLTPSQTLVEEKPRRDGYTGTLKAVIKLNRSGDKKKMVYQRTEDNLGELEYRICSEFPAAEVPLAQLNDITCARKNASKPHNGNDGSNGSATSNGHSDDPESSSHDESKSTSGKDLIIPEKSSSFSIHPGRLCSDVCTYCFGKFGSLDTPCHVAALKAERQKKILENEPHLTAESCLCDACYRYVDRRANCPSKAMPRVKPPTSSQCCVNGCQEQATQSVKKKWLVKLKKSITNKLDIDLDKPGALYFPLCAQHHYWVDYFTVCGICRKRLNRNHLYSLGSETDRLNLMLAEDGIPARLSDKLFLCKLCRYYSNLRLKYADPGSIPHSGQIFYRDYRRKILTSLDIPVSDSEDEPLLKEDKKKPSPVKKSCADNTPTNPNGASSSSKSDESVMTLNNLATLLGDQPEQQPRIQVKFGNVNIGRLSNLNIGQGSREERLPYSEVGLQANLEFEGPVVPDGSWERCVSTIQFDKRTKKLWQDLQKPYGNQSSFLRHLVMLEKYWRAGHLTLTPNTDERVAKYLNGVKNRIKAFEGSSSTSVNKTPATAPPATIIKPTVSSSERFPLLSNNSEIEVTPITVVPKKPVINPVPVPQPEKKPMTPLDRAKSLVRMISPTPRQRYPVPIQRYQMPVYPPSYNYPPQQRPPPLLKIQNKSLHPAPYYHQHIHQNVPGIIPGPPLKPILPKLPSALTVTQVPQGGAAITLNRSGITIEKQSGMSPVTPTLPNEKPSISVFREPAPGPS